MPVADPADTAFDAALFDGAVDAELPARMAVVAGPLPTGALDEAEALLRDIAMVDERRGDEGETAAAEAAGLRRVEAKLDLTLRLLARALPGLAPPLPRSVRLGLRGARIDAPFPEVEAEGVLRWQPADWMPLPLLLPVRRAGSSVAASWWAFDGLPTPLADAVERHVFRLHRRMLAARRRE